LTIYTSRVRVIFSLFTTAVKFGTLCHFTNEAPRLIICIQYMKRSLIISEFKCPSRHDRQLLDDNLQRKLGFFVFSSWRFALRRFLLIARHYHESRSCMLQCIASGLFPRRTVWGCWPKGSQSDTWPHTSFLEGKRINCALSTARCLIRSDEF
jgi:hypothetical protein